MSASGCGQASKCGQDSVFYCTPLEAMKGPRERLIYVTCAQPYPCASHRADYLATVDVDPCSPTYCEVIHRLKVGNLGDELHHSGWNVCGSCTNKEGARRDRLILPCLNSDRIYVADTGSNPRAPSMFKVIDPKVLHDLTNTSAPHTAHCLPSGEVLVSTMGDKNGGAKGSFIVLEGNNFNVKGEWPCANNKASYGYDFWYQPYFNVLISSEWAAPNTFRKGFFVKDLAEGKYGHSLNVWDWKEKTLKQTIDLGPDGQIPLEVRFLHNPKKSEGYVGCALSSTIFRFYLESDGATWAAEKVITIPSKNVTGWLLPSMPGLITDILISLDDRYLYLVNWIHGDIRQYDITDTRHPKQVGQVFVGGSIVQGGLVQVTGETQPKQAFVRGKAVRGGPQMLQLSLDGKRLYVTSSLYSAWDKQFYPDVAKGGAMMCQINVNTETGGLTLNEDFLVDFGLEPDGPCLAHEMRYPGGDPTSDIYLAQ